jgi:hypothetical protein
MNDDVAAVIGLGSARVMRCTRGDLPAAYEVWPDMRALACPSVQLSPMIRR